MINAENDRGFEKLTDLWIKEGVPSILRALKQYDFEIRQCRKVIDFAGNINDTNTQAKVAKTQSFLNVVLKNYRETLEKLNTLGVNVA